MDSKRFCIAVVLTMVGAGYAQDTVTARWRAEGPVEPDSSLYAYVLEASSTIDKISAFIVTIEGNGAHQIWPGGVSDEPSPYKGDVGASDWGKPEWEIYDSHVLAAGSQVISYPEGDLVATETADQSNPTSLALETTVMLGDQELTTSPRIGLGDVSVTLGLGPSLQDSSVDLYRLVVPMGRQVTTRFQVGASGELTSEQSIVVPEPMTMGLLGLGGVALLSRRRRA
jgi:hypothetical protein